MAVEWGLKALTLLLSTCSYVMGRGYLTYLARIQRAPGYYVRGLIDEFGDKDVFLFAQAIAFKVLVSIVPVVVLLAGVAIWLFGDSLLQELQTILPNFLPAYESEQILLFLDQLIRTSTQWTPVAAIGFLVTAVTLVTTVRLAVGNAFEQDWNENRSILAGYLFDLRLVLQVGGFFILTIALTLFAEMVHAEAIDVLAWLGVDFLREGWQQGFRLIGIFLPLLITAAMFWQLYYFIPKPRPPVLSAGIGAAVAAILWEMAKYGFTLYATYVAGFDRFAEPRAGGFTEEGMAALANSFGLIIAFVFWVYYSGVVLLIGALIASLHEQGSRIRKEQRKIERIKGMSKLDAAASQHPVVDDQDDLDRAEKKLTRDPSPE